MALTPSNMIELGSIAAEFKLVNAVDDKTYQLSDFKSAKALLVMFICNHCPYVIHIRPQLALLERDFAKLGLQIVAINANSLKSHPQDGPTHMKTLAKSEGWGFPYLFDATQAVAKAYDAACTPDFFLYDQSRRLVYRGQLDDSRPDNGKPLTGKDLREAIQAALQGKGVVANQKPSVGCNIKWDKNA